MTGPRGPIDWFIWLVEQLSDSTMAMTTFVASAMIFAVDAATYGILTPLVHVTHELTEATVLLVNELFVDSTITVTEIWMAAMIAVTETWVESAVAITSAIQSTLGAAQEIQLTGTPLDVLAVAAGIAAYVLISHYSPEHEGVAGTTIPMIAMLWFQLRDRRRT